MKRTYSTLILSIRCSITLFFIFSVLSVWSQDQKYHRIEAALSRWELPALMDDGLEVDHFDLRDGRFVAEVSESDLEVLKRNNVKFKITLRNLGKNLPKHNRKIDKAYAKGKSALSTQAILTPSNFALGSMGGFFTLDEINDELDEMHDAFPNLITIKSSIGTSIENRDIYMVKISDNPTVDEPEIEVFLNALHHAREPIGASQLIFFMWHILENYDSDPEVRTLVDNMELYFVPAVNPDGYVYNEFTNPNGGGFWRKNRRLNSNGSYGIDLNRNYGHEWGLDNVGSSGNPNSQTYRGTGPFSEPETRAIRDFVNEHEFIAALNYHSFGNLLIYPWGYRQSFVTPDNSTYRAMSTYMTEENNYTFGTGDETVGYVTNGDSDD
ncbi:MAG: M14 family metallopeptidase, partial [Bacteroidota bacterium]